MKPRQEIAQPRHFSYCWLPSSVEGTWLKPYLRAVHLPHQEDENNQTLLLEIKQLSADTVIAAAPHEASLIFKLEPFTGSLPCHGEYLITRDDRAIPITAGDHAGLLYGWFHLLRNITNPTGMNEITKERPAFAIRMINHWDNMDGSIERGYAGRSLFFADNKISYDETRLCQYARLLASVGINALTINNVNVHHHETDLIRQRLLPDVARIAAIFRRYAIQLFLSVNFAAPIETGDLTTADPFDPQVVTWWQQRAKEIYHYIPDFGGYVVKADSEHRPGPFT